MGTVGGVSVQTAASFCVLIEYDLNLVGVDASACTAVKYVRFFGFPFLCASSLGTDGVDTIYTIWLI